MISAGIDNNFRKQIYRRDGFRCVLCDSTRSLQLHHVVPRGRGGPNEEWNLVTLCGACHMAAHGHPIKWAGDPREELVDPEAIEAALVEYLSDHYIETSRLWTPKGLVWLDEVEGPELTEMAQKYPNLRSLGCPWIF